VENSLERCRRSEDIICIQDTTTFVFSDKREGFGFVNRNNSKFPGDFALAVTRSSDEIPVPLGVVAARIWVRKEYRETTGVSQQQLRQSDDCESLRWLETVVELKKLFARIIKGECPYIS
jgi:hypothetical protein